MNDFNISVASGVDICIKVLLYYVKYAIVVIMKTLRVIVSALSTATVLSLLKVSTSSAQMEGIRSGVQAALGNGMPTELIGDGSVFTVIVNTMLFIIGAVAVVMVIFGGFRYVVSGGNAANVTAAKNTILYAIVGVIVALLSYAIIEFVLASLDVGSSGGL